MQEGLEFEGPVAQRLATAANAVALIDLGGRWFHQVIVVSLDRPALHDPPVAILNRIRGALGDGLKRSASAAAIRGEPCTFDPPSAFDILFREQLRIAGRHGVPKPFVLAMDMTRNTFEVRLTLFGFACDWLEAVRERLIEALAERVRWSGTAENVGSRIRSCHVLSSEAMAMPETPDQVVIEFETPFDATGTDFLEEPSTLIGRLARRIDGLSRWMDTRLEVNWDEHASAWKRAAFGVDIEEHGIAERGSRRQMRAIRNPVMKASVYVAGDLKPFWPLLMIGQTCHVGRGAVSGFGRYRLVEA